MHIEKCRQTFIKIYFIIEEEENREWCEYDGMWHGKKYLRANTNTKRLINALNVITN